MRKVILSAEQAAKHVAAVGAYLLGADIQFKTEAGHWLACWSDEMGGPEWRLDTEYRANPWTKEKLESHGKFINAWDRGENVQIHTNTHGWLPMDVTTVPNWGAPVEDYRICPYTRADWDLYKNIIEAHERGEIIEKIASVPAGTPDTYWETLKNTDKNCVINFKPEYCYRISPWSAVQLFAHEKAIRAWEMGEQIEQRAPGRWEPVPQDKRPMFHPNAVFRVKPAYDFEYMGVSIHNMTEERAKEVYAILLNSDGKFKDRKAMLQGLEKFINDKWPVDWEMIFTGVCGCCTLNVNTAGKCYLNGITPAASGHFDCDDGNSVFVNEAGEVELPKVTDIYDDVVHITKEGIAALQKAFEAVESKESLQELALKIATCSDPEARRKFQKRFDEMAANTKQFEPGGVVQVQDSFIHANEEDAKRLRDEFKKAMLARHYSGPRKPYQKDAQRTAVAFGTTNGTKRVPFYERTYDHLVPHNYSSFTNSQALIFKKGEAVRTLLEYNTTHIFLGVPGANGTAITYQQLFDEYTCINGEPCGQRLNTGFFGLPEEEQRKITRDHVTKLAKRGRSKEIKELLAALDADSLSALKSDKLEFFVKQLDKML